MASISKATGYAVISVKGGLSKAVGYAVLSTEVRVSVSKAVAYAVVQEIPENEAPAVFAGPDQSISIASPTAVLAGSATDDGKPDPPAALTYLWTKQSGPGTATFTDATSPTSEVTFSVPGVYVLRLTADDSALTGYDEVTITVHAVYDESVSFAATAAVALTSQAHFDSSLTCAATAGMDEGSLGTLFSTVPLPLDAHFEADFASLLIAGVTLAATPDFLAASLLNATSTLSMQATAGMSLTTISQLAGEVVLTIQARLDAQVGAIIALLVNLGASPQFIADTRHIIDEALILHVITNTTWFAQGWPNLLNPAIIPLIVKGLATPGLAGVAMTTSGIGGISLTTPGLSGISMESST